MTQVVVISLISNEQNKVLLTRRRQIDPEDDPALDKTWQIPGGCLEFGESAEECAIREAKEELGIDIEINHLLHKIFTKTREDWHGIFLVYICKQTNISQKIELNEEADRYGWYSITDVHHLQLTPLTKQILREYYGSDP